MSLLARRMPTMLSRGVNRVAASSSSLRTIVAWRALSTMQPSKAKASLAGHSRDLQQPHRCNMATEVNSLPPSNDDIRLRDQAPLRVAVVGAGPAGMYSTDFILTQHPGAIVDVYDELPSPYGLVRSGVAPDHPEVKNVTRRFDGVFNNERCRYFGNVRIELDRRSQQLGSDIALSTLQQHYDAILLSHGAPAPNTLNIPGEDLPGVYQANDFVNWYNSHPLFQSREFHLTPDVAIVGLGNVALDVARILMSPIDTLAQTDIARPALAAIADARIKSVTLLARRGPAHAACTTKEFREMVRLPNVNTKLRVEDMQANADHVSEGQASSRQRKRLLKLLQDTAAAKEWDQSAEREIDVQFYTSPLAFLPGDGGAVRQVRCIRNEVSGTYDTPTVQAIPGTEKDIDAGTVFISIGNRREPVLGLGDTSGQALGHEHGRVIGGGGDGGEGERPQLYAAGWAKRGARGIITDTLADAEDTVATLLADHSEQASTSRRALQPLGELYSQVQAQARANTAKTKCQGVGIVSFDEWRQLDLFELDNGAMLGAARIKIPSLQQMQDMITHLRKRQGKAQ